MCLGRRRLSNDNNNILRKLLENCSEVILDFLWSDEGSLSVKVYLCECVVQ